MAAADPMRAITAERKQWDMEEFFATAKPHMDELFSVAASIGAPQQFDRALDFGCGAGRFARYLSSRFTESWGVDVSTEMIDLARRYCPQCKFHLNTAADLSIFPDAHFDLIFSFLVLQHLPTQDLIEQYIREFLRILKPGGLAAFQVPDHLSLRWRIQPRRRLYGLLRQIGFSPDRLHRWNLLPMRLTAIPEHRVRSIVFVSGGEVRHRDCSGMYYCVKCIKHGAISISS